MSWKCKVCEAKFKIKKCNFVIGKSEYLVVLLLFLIKKGVLTVLRHPVRFEKHSLRSCVFHTFLVSYFIETRIFLSETAYKKLHSQIAKNKKL